MENRALEHFNLRLEKLEPSERARFVHGVYKQLTKSAKGRQTNGEYRKAIGELNKNNACDFCIAVVDALDRYGLKSHSDKLLKQVLTCGQYGIFAGTNYQLDKIDPRWKDYVTISPWNNGIAIETGDYYPGGHGTSIILHDGSYGRKKGLYEIRPLFRFNTLKDFGRGDEVIGYLKLEDAVALSQAVMRDDETKFKELVDRL